MNTAELTNCGFTSVVTGEDKEITGIFTGDLLSWAIGRAKAGNVWFTVMGNVNAIAVATLVDCACIVLCQEATFDKMALIRAEQQGISLFTTPLPEFEASLALAKALGM